MALNVFNKHALSLRTTLESMKLTLKCRATAQANPADALVLAAVLALSRCGSPAQYIIKSRQDHQVTAWTAVLAAAASEVHVESCFTSSGRGLTKQVILLKAKVQPRWLDHMAGYIPVGCMPCLVNPCCFKNSSCREAAAAGE